MTIAITPETRLACRTDLLSSSLSDTEVVMMDIDKGKYYGVEDVGRFIWDYLAETHSVSEVCAQVSEHFEVDFATAQTDTIEFLTHLLSEGLVQLDADRPAA